MIWISLAVFACVGLWLDVKAQAELAERRRAGETDETPTLALGLIMVSPPGPFGALVCLGWAIGGPLWLFAQSESIANHDRFWILAVMEVLCIAWPVYVFGRKPWRRW